MEKKINIIIDSDPGVDDAIALMYACTCEELNIELISTTGGNGTIENITENALHLCELFDAKIPVVKGSPKPLKREANYAVNAQGKRGLGNYCYNSKKLKTRAVDGEACDVIYETLKKNSGKTTIVSIGPMTNLAKMIEKHPDCKKYIKEIVFESGTKEKIYGKPYKSFNVGYDPESAEVVFASGIKLVMVPMELGHFAYLDKDDIKQFKKTNKTGRIFVKMFKGYNDYHVGKLGAAVHDVCTIYYLTHPECMKTEQAYIEIKYYNESTSKDQNFNKQVSFKKIKENFGYIDIDFFRKPNATVCMDLNINIFKHDLFEALKKYK